MALTYRSPLEDIVAAFDPAVQSSISNTAAQSYKEYEQSNFELFNYALSAKAKERLSTSGIYLSPYSAVPHSHPVCKTLENYFLYKVLPSYLDSRFYFVGIKNFKLELLKKRSKNLDLVSSINRFVSSADKLRYTSDFVRLQSSKSASLVSKRVVLEDVTLRDLLPAAMARSAKYLFLHDELHYWSKRTLMNFLSELQPEVVLATVVIPPETLAGAKESLNRWCYEYEVSGSKLYFYPDGVRAEGYEQPLGASYLLKCGRLLLDDGQVYCVDVVCSKFAHHLLCISKGDAVVPTRRSYGPFDATSARGLSNLTASLKKYIPVNFEVMSKVYRYLRTLKKPDAQSAMAKLSQILPSPTSAEIKFVSEFADLVIETKGIHSMICPARLTLWLGKVGNVLPPCWRERIATVKEVSLDEFVASFEPYTLNVEVVDVSTSSVEYIVELFTAEVPVTETDLLKAMSRFNSGESVVLDRTPQRYTGMAPLSGKVEFSLELNYDALPRFCADNFIKSYSRFDEPKPAIESIKVVIQHFSRVSLAFPMRKVGVFFGQAKFWRRVMLSVHAKLARYSRASYPKDGVGWFQARRRANQKYLCGTGDHPSVVHVVRSAWTMVVQEVTAKGDADLPWIEHASEAAGCHITGSNSKTQPDEVSVCGEHALCVKMKVVCTAHSGLNGFNIGAESRSGLSYIAFGRHTASKDALKSCGFYVESEWPAWLDQWLEVVVLDAAYNVCVVRMNQVTGGGAQMCFENLGKLSTENTALVCLSGKASLVNCRDNCDRAMEVTEGGTLRLEGEARTLGEVGLKCANAMYVDVVMLRLVETTASVELAEAPTEVRSDRGEPALCYDNLGAQVTIVSEASMPKGVLRDVPGDGDCYWHCLAEVLDMSAKVIKKLCCERLLSLAPKLSEEVMRQVEDGESACDELIAISAALFGLCIIIHNEQRGDERTFKGHSATIQIKLLLKGEHFQLILPRNNCVLRAIGQALKRSEVEVLKVVNVKCTEALVGKIWEGEGVGLDELDLVFSCFDIRAIVHRGNEQFVLNEQGKVVKSFSATDDHLEYLERKRTPSAELLMGHKKCREVDQRAVNELAMAGTSLVYEISATRARVLAECLLEGLTGAFSSELFDGKRSLMPTGTDVEAPRCARVHVIMGTFGAGKSTLFKKFMGKCSGRKVTYVSPRKVLADSFKSMMGLGRTKGESALVGAENWSVRTFEAFLHTAFTVEKGEALLFDEIQLYPPGYLDLVCCIVPPTAHLFLIGDPCQSEYDNEQDRAVFSDSQTDIMRLLDRSEYRYTVGSYRFLNPKFENRLPCSFLNFNEEDEEDLYVLREGVERLAEVEEKYKEVFLVSSFEEKKLVKCYSSMDANVLTFGESTGSTFNYATLLITRASAAASERRWLTALSRARRGLYIINATGLGMEGLIMSYSQRSLGGFLTGRSKKEDLLKLLPGKPIFQEVFYPSLCKDEGIMEEKLQGDPWLKTMIDLLQMPDVEEAEELAEVMQEEWFKTHLPQCELESVRARWVHKILAKEAREKRMGMLISEQFTDEHSKNRGMQLTNACERFETIYPRHRANDTVTFIMAVKKRLRFSSPAKEKAKLHEASNYGRYLMEIFLKKVPLRREHNTELMAQAKHEFELKKTSKSAATIENHSGRSCRDWLVDIGQIFSKSQICTKFDNRFRDAKAAQTIVCFQHAVLCRFAPYMRYIEKKLHEVLPKKYYIHSGKGLDELNNWVIEGQFEGCCTESDYEAFDASQDQYIMAFEIEIMKYLGLPRDLIADYQYIKTHLGSKLGNFAIMRFSGEASTFLFNTMANMLFTFMRYEIKGNEYICFAGDDMCSSKRLQVSRVHEAFLGKLKLKAKVQHTSKPTFCGWNLCADGIYKKPQLVLERMCIAKETDNLRNCIDNYAIEVAFAYKLGERAVNRMDEEELEAFYNCVRIIVKNKHHCRSNVVEVFSNANV